ncbi:MAG TPA: glycosyltransferase [Thermoleophilaceae bacterium]
MPDLVITSYTPARTTGRGVRTCGIIQALARLGDVEVAYVPFGGGSPASDLAAAKNVTLRRVDPSRGPRRLFTAGWALARGATFDFARAVSPEVMAVARDAAADVRVIADGPTAAAALLPLARRRSAVYVAHNLESSFRGTPRLRSFERRVLGGFAECWMATHADMDSARALAGSDLRLRHAPNVVDVASLPVPAARPGSETALFVGDFTYAPNAEGLSYLVDEVMPRVWHTLPGASVNVVGRGVERAPADTRIRILGFVDDLDAAYAAADAVVVPLLTGGGSPLKLVEALARGMPVVTTTHAANMIEAGRTGEHFLAAGDADSFAAALVSALSGQAADLGTRARALAQEHLSIESLVRALSSTADERFT